MPDLLTAAQRAAVENRGGPLLVSAAAGAGKTRVLVERLLEQVRAGEDIDRFLVITFTNAAAAELRARVADELSRTLAGAPGNRHLRRQPALVYNASISTVHAYCGDFLRRWGHLIDLDPDFRLCDEGEAKTLRAEALKELLERRYEAPDEALSLLLDVFSGTRDDWALGNMVLEIYGKLQGHPEPEAWLEEQRRAYDVSGLTDAAQTPWGAYLLGRYRSMARYWYDCLSGALEESREAVPMYAESLEATLAGLDALARAERWEEARAPEFPKLGSTAKCGDKALAQRVKALRDRCKDRFQKLAQRLDLPSAQLLDDLAHVAPAARALLELVGEFARSFAALKARRGVLDFNDLEHLTLRILTQQPQAAREEGARFREVMVDEYQDTNQVQNAIFAALTAQRGNLFLVGDVKQSIYRFRLADPTLFLERYRAYPDWAQARSGQGRRVILGENFRSRPEVIEGVNFLFENLMSREMGELDYGPDEALRVGIDRPRREDCKVELHLLSNPKADEEGDSSMVEPRFVARRLRRLVDEGFPVSDGQGGLRPVRPGDMAILLRAPNRVLGRYARALAEVGLPWESGEGEDFFDTPETSVAISYLELVDNPRQDVPLIAVLRSPLYGFTPDRLAQLSRRRGSEGFFEALLREEQEEPQADARAFLEDLRALRLAAPDKRSYELLWELYCRTGMLALYAAMPGGETRRAHLLGLYSYARRYEGSGHKGLFGFLTHLHRCRDEGVALSLPAGQGGEGVRVLSIHRSKGLEYPVVAVAGLGKGFNHQDSQAPMLFHRELGLGPKGVDEARRIRYPTLARWAVGERLEEEMRGEELRLLYVALTRAREKLILTCAMKDPAREIERLAEYATLPAAPEALAAQPTAGHWILCAALCRPEAGPLLQGLVLPHVPPAGTEYGGAWEMALEDGEPLQRHRAPGAGPGEAAAPAPGPAASVPDYAWRYPYEGAAQIPSKLTATQLKGRTLDGEVEEEAPRPPRPVLFDRPAFARATQGLTPGERGTAHHMVMQFLDFSQADVPGGVEREIARMVEREIITPQQGRAVDPEVIRAFFCSPLGREALAAGEGLHREFKFSVLRPAELYYPQLPPGEMALVQGVVDCWFDTPQGLVILDFKSDAVTADALPARAEEYRPQLEVYADALASLLGRPVARRTLWFFSQNRAWEV